MAASLQTERKKEKVQDTALAPAVGLFVLFLWGWGWGSWGVCVCGGGGGGGLSNTNWCMMMLQFKWRQIFAVSFFTVQHTLTQSSPVSSLPLSGCVDVWISYGNGKTTDENSVNRAALSLTFLIKRSHTHTHITTTKKQKKKNSGNPSVFKDGVSCTDSNVAVNGTWRVHKSRCMNWWSCIMGDPATAGHGKQGHSTVHYMAHCFCWEWCKYIHTVCILTGIQAETSVYPSF